MIENMRKKNKRRQLSCLKNGLLQRLSSRSQINNLYKYSTFIYQIQPKIISGALLDK